MGVGTSYYLLMTFLECAGCSLWSKKSEVFEVFQNFKASVENQSCSKIKALRIDNSSEYNSEKFKKLCEANGIHHQLTVRYTPQQNGVCERKNRTVLGMARCMLLEKKLPKSFWAEAVNVAVISRTDFQLDCWRKKHHLSAGLAQNLQRIIWRHLDVLRVKHQ